MSSLTGNIDQSPFSHFSPQLGSNRYEFRSRLADFHSSDRCLLGTQHELTTVTPPTHQSRPAAPRRTEPPCGNIQQRLTQPHMPPIIRVGGRFTALRPSGWLTCHPPHGPLCPILEEKTVTAYDAAEYDQPATIRGLQSRVPQPQQPASQWTRAQTAAGDGWKAAFAFGHYSRRVLPATVTRTTAGARFVPRDPHRRHTAGVDSTGGNQIHHRLRSRRQAASGVRAPLDPPRHVVAVAVDYRLGWNPLSTDQDVRTGTIINAAYRCVQDAHTCVRYFRMDATLNGNTFGIDTSKFVIGGIEIGRAHV